MPALGIGIRRRFRPARAPDLLSRATLPVRREGERRDYERWLLRALGCRWLDLAFRVLWAFTERVYRGERFTVTLEPEVLLEVLQTDPRSLARAIEINEAHERLVRLGGDRYEVLAGDPHWFARGRRDFWKSRLNESGPDAVHRGRDCDLSGRLAAQRPRPRNGSTAMPNPTQERREE